MQQQAFLHSEFEIVKLLLQDFYYYPLVRMTTTANQG